MGRMIALVAGPQKPPRSFQGLGLAYLAAMLEQNGHPVNIFDLYPPSVCTEDAALLDRALADAIAQEQPSIVGMTIHTPVYAERVRLAALVRQRIPQVLLVAGGHHPTAEPEELLRNSAFDACVIGEGEETLLQVAQLSRAECRPAAILDALHGVAGLVYRRAGQIFRTAPRAPTTDPDSLPIPAHHLLRLQDYGPHPNLHIRSTGIVTYRGCPLRCAFCINPQGHKLRLRDPAQIAEEMAGVVREYDMRGFNVYDNLFGINHAHTRAVCEAILRRRLAVTWDCWTAGNLVDVPLARLMKAAGCTRVGFGAESGDDAVLRQSRRGFTCDQHLEGIRSLRTAGVHVSAFFMLGLPGETQSSVARTLEFARHCGADEICLGLHRPYPGTAVWRHPEAFGVRIVTGPNFEAYIETATLSRNAMVESALQAREDLKRDGLMKGDFLRFDRYAWE